jgi:hypothetical protein
MALEVKPPRGRFPVPGGTMASSLAPHAPQKTNVAGISVPQLVHTRIAVMTLGCEWAPDPDAGCADDGAADGGGPGGGAAYDGGPGGGAANGGGPCGGLA